jgi:predicted HTH domain antitoxin
MPVTTPDSVLQQVRLSERRFLIEAACRPYAAQLLGKAEAGKLCGLDRLGFEAELYKQDAPVYIYTREMLEQDLRFVRSIETDRAGWQ